MFLLDKELDLSLVGGKGYKLIYFRENSDLLIPDFKCVSSLFFDEYKKDIKVLDVFKKRIINLFKEK